MNSTPRTRNLIRNLYLNSRNTGFFALFIGGMSALFLAIDILSYLFDLSILDFGWNLLVLADNIEQVDFAKIYGILLCPFDIVIGIFLLKVSAHFYQVLSSEINYSSHLLSVLRNINRIILVIYAQHILLIIMIWTTIFTGGSWQVF